MTTSSDRQHRGAKMKWPDDYVNQVVCGDCFEILPVIPDGSIDLVVTDPWYELNVNHGSGIMNRENVTVFKKIGAIGGFTFDILPFLAQCQRVLKIFNGYFWCSVKQLPVYLNWAIENKMIFDVLTWHKNNPAPLCCNGHLGDTEYCVFIRQSGAHWNNGLWYKTYRSYWVTPRVWGIDHPCAKPLNIMKAHILVSSDPDQIVLDPCCGSGTTCVAAKELDRQFIGIEKEEKFCKLARERLSQEVLF